jgi:hypothetical protein
MTSLCDAEEGLVRPARSRDVGTGRCTFTSAEHGRDEVFAVSQAPVNHAGDMQREGSERVFDRAPSQSNATLQSISDVAGHTETTRGALFLRP